MQCNAQRTYKCDYAQAYQGGCFVSWQTVFLTGAGMKGLKLSTYCTYLSLVCHFLTGLKPHLRVAY